MKALTGKLRNWQWCPFNMYIKIIMYSVLRIIALIVLALGFLFLTGCQKRNSIFGHETEYGLVFDGTVPEDQRNLIIEDFENIKNVYVNGVDNRDLEIIGLNLFFGNELFQWLNKRIKYIAGESFDYQEQYFIVNDRGYNPQVFESNKLVTVMTNLGGGLYRYGKNNSMLLGINIAGKDIEIKSPRSGVVKIGEGLFTAVSIKNSELNSLANSYLRLHVYFHEGRHGDGNGDNVSFPHVMCPFWHNYSGYYACDNSTNGPYAVGAAVLKSLIKACITCTNTELQIMKAIQADSEYRILPGFSDKDVRPERIY